MRVAATNVLPGDRVRGIGLVVDDVVPETDFTTAITGHVSTREGDGEFGVFSGVKVVLPNEHVVNVVRSDENFRADRVAAVGTALTAFRESDDVEAFVAELTRIGSMPRGAYVSATDVELYVTEVATGDESDEQILDRLDEPADDGAVVTVIPFD